MQKHKQRHVNYNTTHSYNTSTSLPILILQTLNMVAPLKMFHQISLERHCKGDNYCSKTIIKISCRVLKNTFLSFQML